jgi:hypothetical protein
MVSRGFRGEIKVLRRHSLTYYDILFAVVMILLFFVFRNYDIVNFIGSATGRLLR